MKKFVVWKICFILFGSIWAVQTSNAGVIDGKFIVCDESQYDNAVGYGFRQGRWVTYNLRSAASAEWYDTGVYETDKPDRKYLVTDTKILFREPNGLNYDRVQSVYELDRISLIREVGEVGTSKDPTQCRLVSKSDMFDELERIWRAQVEAKRKADEELKSLRKL